MSGKDLVVASTDVLGLDIDFGRMVVRSDRGESKTLTLTDLTVWSLDGDDDVDEIKWWVRNEGPGSMHISYADQGLVNLVEVDTWTSVRGMMWCASCFV